MVSIGISLTNYENFMKCWRIFYIFCAWLFLTHFFQIWLHCKYIRPHYDGTLAIHRSSTTIHSRYQLQCIIWKFLISKLRSCYQCTWSYAILYIWRITILDCNVYNESNLTSYYQLTWDFGIKVKIFIKSLHKECAAY